MLWLCQELSWLSRPQRKLMLIVAGGRMPGNHCKAGLCFAIKLSLSTSRIGAFLGVGGGGVFLHLFFSGTEIVSFKLKCLGLGPIVDGSF